MKQADQVEHRQRRTPASLHQGKQITALALLERLNMNAAFVQGLRQATWKAAAVRGGH